MKRFYAALMFLVLAASIWLYKSSIDYFFFQDDFFEINISQAGNLQQYLEFFKARSDIIAYRPISLQNYFFLSAAIFGLNPAGFRFITFILFLLSFFLIVKISANITKSFSVGFITAAFWLLSSIHFMTITWIAAAYNIIGTFFWLLTSFIFIKFIESDKHWLYLLSIVSFFLTIGSYEFSVTWPAILGFYYLFVLKKPLTRGVKIFLPFILISLVYLAARLLFIKVPQIPEYNVTFNVESIKAFFWYLLWTFNIPEEFKKQVVTNLIIFNSKFLSEYWPLVLKTYLGAFIILTIGLIIPSFRIIKDKLKVNMRLILFTLFWFAVGISPVLLIPNHTFSMYLTLSSIGAYMLIAYLLSFHREKVIVPVVLVIWLATSYITLDFYKVNSWMVETQRFARTFTIQAKKQLPILPTSAIILYQINDKRIIQALLDQHAIRTIYNDPTLSIYYNKKDLLVDYNNIKNRPIYIYLPE